MESDGILSHCTSRILIDVIRAKDHATLVAIPGIGKWPNEYY